MAFPGGTGRRQGDDWGCSGFLYASQPVGVIYLLGVDVEFGEIVSAWLLMLWQTGMPFAQRSIMCLKVSLRSMRLPWARSIPMFEVSLAKPCSLMLLFSTSAI